MGKRGPAKGTKYRKTREKEAMREALRRIVDREMEEMTAAQVAAAKGIKYLVARSKQGGTFRPVTDIQAALKNDDLILEVWEKQPSTQAYTDLLNRAIDKAKEQEIDVNVKGLSELVSRINAGRERLKKK